MVRQIYFYLLFLSLANAENPIVTNIISNIPKVATAQETIVNNVISLRLDDFGWGYETPRVITNLQIYFPRWYGENHESLLSVKQNDLDLVLTLLKNDTESMTGMNSGHVAMFINSIIATCRNPRNIFGLDLIDIVKPMPVYHPFTLAYVSLAICTSGAVVKPGNVEKMVENINKFVDDEVDFLDNLAETMLALSCIDKRNPHQNYKDAIQKAKEYLKRRQNVDGSFGHNVDTTITVVQALIEDENWNITAAINYFINQDMVSLGLRAIEILPILIGRGYIDLMNVDCAIPERSTTTTTTSFASEDDYIGLEYSVWIGDEAEQKYSLRMIVKKNTTFYNVMKIASDLDPRFQFEAEDSSFGHYVTSINGIKQDMTTNKYWTIGKIIGNDETPTALNTGVDGYIPQSGDHVVLWYKTLNF